MIDIVFMMTTDVMGEDDDRYVMFDFDTCYINHINKDVKINAQILL